MKKLFLSFVFSMLCLVQISAHAHGSSHPAPEAESHAQNYSLKPCFIRIGDTYLDANKVSTIRTRSYGKPLQDGLFWYTHITVGKDTIELSALNKESSEKWAQDFINFSTKHCNWR